MNARLSGGRAAFALALAASCAGCSGVETMIPGAVGARTTEGIEAHSGTASEADKFKVLPLSAADLDCPSVDIAEGGATFRVGGPDNAAVRYQFDIGDTARECAPQGAQFALRIGVSGLLLIGPAGAPGSYSADLKIVVANVGDKKPVYQKAYKIAANTNGGTQAPFQLVLDPVLLPLTRTDLDSLYTVTIGLGNSVSATAPPRKRKQG